MKIRWFFILTIRQKTGGYESRLLIAIKALRLIYES